MTSKERFLSTYNNPVQVVEAASIPVNPVGVVTPRKASILVAGPPGLGTWFMEDPRNMGGKHLIDG